MPAQTGRKPEGPAQADLAPVLDESVTTWKTRARKDSNFRPSASETACVSGQSVLAEDSRVALRTDAPIGAARPCFSGRNGPYGQHDRKKTGSVPRGIARAFIRLDMATWFTVTTLLFGCGFVGGVGAAAWWRARDEAPCQCMPASVVEVRR